MQNTYIYIYLSLLYFAYRRRDDTPSGGTEKLHDDELLRCGLKTELVVMHVRGNWIIRYSDDVENPPSVTGLVTVKWVVTEKLRRRRRITTLNLTVNLHTCSALGAGYCALCTGYCTLCTGYSLMTCTRLSYWNLHSTTKLERIPLPDVAVIHFM